MNLLLPIFYVLIVQWPCYQSLFEIAHSIGCDVTEWKMDGKNNWKIDISFLKKHIKKNTKAIVINSPHNPAGYIIPEEKLREIIEIASEHDIYIFSDEVYRFLEYDEKDRFLSLCDSYDKGSMDLLNFLHTLIITRGKQISIKNRRIFFLQVIPATVPSLQKK